MPRQKRQYVPKVKGCYECSQRRIHCDRAEPICGKCVSRGIPCSGLGIRYRFNDGETPSKIEWGRKRLLRRRQGGDPPLRKANRLVAAGSDVSETSTDDEAMTTMRPRSLPIVDPGNEFLLTYFSHHVAPHMVVMDNKYNGWRSLILPLALSDQTVLDAVLAVSAFHLSHQGRSGPMVGPDKLYMQAIVGLQKRSCLDEYDMLTRQSVFVVILTLLVGVMVNDSSDFPILFHMLQSAFDTVGGERGLGNGDMADFLRQQIRKTRVYAAPLLSLEFGVSSIVSYALDSFDYLHYNSRFHPDDSRTFSAIAELQQQAYDIYLQRALLGPRATVDCEKIERFKRSLELFSVGSFGEHALVWPTLMAASESSQQEHRLFFKHFLERQYRSTGFLNLLKALTFLEEIWAQSNTHWPALLPEPRVLIM
ncbi:hypothetical protein ABOM_000060 [Aspergillus bombycis]|uniref:Zn(2)-C6 fungal-type domain-containing protein n=1 Tax=Aspergillus bombycis TaxID=109264 RepID=A0A1F8AHQ1_9EURO|nr:hypothetical protein ABOM_000060 [Aspergillus bombycis]OGM51231.1 hypothetical protein ABOM_000060 [Aspergillus bombycis]